MKKNTNRCLSLLLALILALMTAACKSTEDPPFETPDATEALMAVQTADLSKTAKSTTHFSFSEAEIVYIYAELFRQYSYMLSLYGYDLTKSLKTQMINSTTSVYDYLLDNVDQMTDYYLLLAEAAWERGLTLDDADLETLQKQKESLEETAAAHGWPVNTYLSQYFMTDVTLDAVTNATKIFILADKGEAALLEENPVTDQMIRERFDADPNAYTVIDYIALNLAGTDGIALEDMEELVKEFSAAEGMEAFTRAVEHFLTLLLSESARAEIEDWDAYVQEYIDKASESAVSYAGTSPFFVWAYGEDAREDTCWVAPEEADGFRMVYYLIRRPYEKVTRTVDIRHILFKTSEYDNDADKARAKAEEVYAAWLANGAKEEEFITLAAQYSADGNAAQGGIYEGVKEGDMVPAFNDWIFDTSRMPGDSGIVDTFYGSHMMFFIQEHTTIDWQAAIRETLLDELYERFVTDLRGKYPVKKDEAVFRSLVW